MKGIHAHTRQYRRNPIAEKITFSFGFYKENISLTVLTCSHLFILEMGEMQESFVVLKITSNLLV